ncbi:MAG: hypothetical protein IKY23_10410 [Lachnospiraceae bacterium]|nr:hypothetical protein [Lachnospiraceae bacterium]
MKKRNRKFKNVPAEKKSIHDPNQINTTVEIPMYAPNQGLSPKEYQISAQLAQLEATFKTHCMEFLSKSNPDLFNSSYMDAVIERICEDAIKFVKVQRCDHVYTIMKLLNDMHDGDYIKCKSKLADFKRDKETNLVKLNKYKKIYYHGTSLEEE